MTWPSTFSASDALTADEMDAILAMGNAWTTYTPTLTNITKGNGTLTGRYLQPGGDSKIVDFVVQLTLGSTSAIAPAATVSLPVTAKLAHLSFNGAAWDDSAGISYAIFGHTWTSKTTVNVRTSPTTAGNALSSIGAAVPFTWTTSDVLTISGRYEAA